VFSKQIICHIAKSKQKKHSGVEAMYVKIQ